MNEMGHDSKMVFYGEVGERMEVVKHDLVNYFPFTDKRIAELEAEVERLTDLFQDLRTWANAYPLDVFFEPDLKEAARLLCDGGMTLSAVSASNMRHVLTGIAGIVDKALGES